MIIKLLTTDDFRLRKLVISVTKRENVVGATR